MAQITIDTSELGSPKYFGLILGVYFSNASDDDVYEIKFNELPEKLQLYYYYLDVEERKEFTALADKESGIVLADWNGDRAILEDSRMVTSPYFYRDNVWLDWSGESMRFMMDIEENLMTKEEE